MAQYYIRKATYVFFFSSSVLFLNPLEASAFHFQI